MKKPTIKDVAREAGVSVGSVHLAINQKSGISEKNKKHILKVANKLGYKPNVLASNLKRECRNVIVVLPMKDERTVFYYDPMWKAVNDFEETAKDYNLNIIKIGYTNLVDALNGIDLDSTNGVITVGYPEEDCKEAINRICKAKIPVVLIDSDLSDTDRICSVKPNTKILGKLTGELLLNTIHRLDGKILVCGGDKSYHNHSQVVDSLCEYLEDEGIRDRLVIKNFWEITDDTVTLLENTLKNENIIGCCSVNSTSTMALSKAIINVGLSRRIPVIGSGVFKQSIENLKNNSITAIIDKKSYEQCNIAMKIMSDLLVKNVMPSEEIVDVGIDVVFKSLIDQYEKGL